jgi:hypothetical protein
MSAVPRKRPNRGRGANDEKGQEETHARNMIRQTLAHETDCRAVCMGSSSEIVEA